MRNIFAAVLLTASSCLGQTTQEKAEKGDAEAQFVLGNSYLSRDPKQAVVWIERAARQAHLEALCVYAEALAEGKLVPQNPTEAMRYARIAADFGYPNGQHLTGLLVLRSSETDFSSPFAVASRLYWGAHDASRVGSTETERIVTQLKFSEAAKAQAIRNLNLIRQHSEIILADFSSQRWIADSMQVASLMNFEGAKQRASLIAQEEAAKWFILAAKQGDAGASAARDRILEGKTQEFVSKAMKSAASFVPLQKPDLPALRSKAATGDVESQFNLGYCLYRGIGSPRDESSALTFLRMASQKGNAQAQTLLAAALIKIRGRDSVMFPEPLLREEFEALTWLLLASANEVRARELFESFKPSLSPAELTEIQRRAVAWRSAPAVEEARKQAKLEAEKRLVAFLQAQAARGYDFAQHDLALRLLEGRGIQQNVTEAKKLLEQAAAQGHKRAQAKLSELMQGKALDGQVLIK